MRAAFKEWEIIVDALGRGEQILLLRKGGIQEGRGGFRPEYRRFLLFPTRYHQQREGVLATAQARFDQMRQRSVAVGQVRLEFGAELVEAHRIENLSQAKALHGQHVWLEEIIERRAAKERSTLLPCAFSSWRPRWNSRWSRPMAGASRGLCWSATSPRTEP